MMKLSIVINSNMAIKQATLTSPDKKFKTIVNVGSSEASQLQSKGWGIGDTGLNVLPLAQALTHGGNIAPTPISAPVAQPQNVVPPPTQQPVQQSSQQVQQPQSPQTQPSQPAQQTPPTTPPVAQQIQQPEQATLQSPDGRSKVVVNVGSSEASQLQTQGWTLGAPMNAAVLTPQQALTPASTSATSPDLNQAQNPTQSINPNQELIDASRKATVDGLIEQGVTDPVQALDYLNFDNQGNKIGDFTLDEVSKLMGKNVSNDFNFDNLDLSKLNTTDPTTELLSKYGITPPSASSNPVQDYASIYNQLLTSMGLPDIKNEFNKVQQKYTALQNELNDGIASINDDPWLSEGMRVGQIKRLQDRYEGKLQILTDQQKLYDSLYQQGVQQAQYVANAAFQQQQFNSQQGFNIANLALREQEARASLKSAKIKDQLDIAREMRQELNDKAKNENDRIDNARLALTFMKDTFGVDVFNSMSASEKRNWEQDAGLEVGSLDNKVTDSGIDKGDPVSYREWVLAGKPGKYADWVRKIGAETGRPLPASQAQLLGEGAQLDSALNPLYDLIENNKDLFGPVVGKNVLNPYATQSRSIDADLRRATQAVGKFLEGGVLRKEDEEKYRKILPVLTDTPEVAKYKLDGVKELIRQKQEEYLKSFGDAGFNVSGYNQTQSSKSSDPLDKALDEEGFNSPLSMGEKGLDLNKLASSLVTQESGGNYRTVGLVPAGMTEADKALGKYQIIPKYHFGKIGLANTQENRQKFLNSPQLQDQLFQMIIGDLAKTYNNNPRKIAAAYYGGAGGAKKVGTPAGNIKQKAGGKTFPSINEYVNSVMSRLS